MGTFREHSRNAYSEEKPTHEGIRTGSMQRIADACELIAKDRQKLLQDLENYKAWYKSRGERIEELVAEVKALKAVKTRYHNQLKKLKALPADDTKVEES